MAEHREEPARHEEGVDAHSGLLDDLLGLGLLWLAARVGCALDDRAGGASANARGGWKRGALPADDVEKGVERADTVQPAFIGVEREKKKKVRVTLI